MLTHVLNRCLLLTVAVTTVLALMPNLAQAQLSETFDYAPENANVSIVVPNIKSLNEKWATFCAASGIPQSKSLIESTFGEMKIKEGLNTDAPAAVFMLNIPESMKNRTEPQAIVLVPVTDYKAFLSNFGAEAKADITPIKVNKVVSYVRQIDNYALIGKSDKAVKNYKPANASAAMSQTIGTYGHLYAKDADVVMYVNMESMATELDKQIQQMFAEQKQQMQMLAEMGMLGGQGDSAIMMMDIYSKILGAINRGTRGIVFSGTLNDDGMILSKGMLMKPDSSLAQAMPGTGAGLGSTLSDLPAQSFIFSTALDLGALNLEMLLDEMEEMMPEAQEGMDNQFEIYKKMLPMLESTKSAAMALYTPDQQSLMTGGLFKTVTMYDTEDGDAFVEEYAKYLKDINGMSFEAGPGMPDAQGNPGPPMKMTMATQVTTDAMQIEGVDVDQYDMTINMPPAMMQQMGPAAMFMSAFTRYQGFIANKDNDVMITTSLDTMLAKQTLSGIGKNLGVADMPQNKSAASKLDVPNQFAQVMVSADGIALTANQFMTMFGMQPIQIANQLEPMIMAAGIDGQNVGGQTYVPARTIRFISDSINSIEQNMQPPQGGGGQGGQPPF